MQNKGIWEIQMALLGIWACFTNDGHEESKRKKAHRIWNDFELSKEDVYRVFAEYGHISTKGKSTPECQITFQDISEECWDVLERLELI